MIIIANPFGIRCVLRIPNKIPIWLSVLRLALAIALPLMALFSILFLVGLLLVVFDDFSISRPISLPSQCKIVSKGLLLLYSITSETYVHLLKLEQQQKIFPLSSKICELGLLNYKAKDVFHHFERSKYRCRFDHYWASVFQVEYKDNFSGQIQVAFAEAPNEALPLYCRPNFGAAWLAQYKFKVNETYDCWYTSGVSKVRFDQDNLFSCQADGQSALEKIKLYSNMATEMVRSWFSGRIRNKYWKWETIAGLMAGFSTSLISITFFRFLQLLLSKTYRCFTSWILYVFSFGILILCSLTSFSRVSHRFKTACMSEGTDGVNFLSFASAILHPKNMALQMKQDSVINLAIGHSLNIHWLLMTPIFCGKQCQYHHHVEAPCT
ncbi:hypothetical protein Ahy_A10g048172 [Arachis hypogaea]|uniref:Uncharacterized protein n=1 Tax=Arachis hypogaea TaxID=3818 RepID=A0A445B4H3_ARAHY|nr:hypothetical protein Ahy_A10g048172 [Arachis hypogaea]